MVSKYNLGGRPVAFKSPEEMLAKMQEFIDVCEGRIVTKIVKGVVVDANLPAPITIEAFCAFAGITKTTFYDYGKKKKFKPLVAQFRQIVESYWVDQCAEGVSGNKADFVLKNCFSEDWKDKNINEIDFSQDIKAAMVRFVDADGGCEDC